MSAFKQIAEKFSTAYNFCVMQITLLDPADSTASSPSKRLDSFQLILDMF
jgi:hypothetical protein